MDKRLTRPQEMLLTTLNRGEPTSAKQIREFQGHQSLDVVERLIEAKLVRRTVIHMPAFEVTAAGRKLAEEINADEAARDVI